MNTYGRFDDENREYVITDPATPLPWINYLGCNDFLGIISNTAGGYSFYRDARLRRLTRYRYNNVPMDGNGRYVYVRDGGTVWNPSWKPSRTKLDRYECRHGLGYTRIEGERDKLAVAVTYFIPWDRTTEIWNVQVRNESNSIRKVRLWGFIEWCLWDAYDDMTNFQRNFSTGEVEIDKQAILHVTEFRERRSHYAYFASSLKPSGFDTSRDAFVGLHNGLDSPAAVMRGECTGSVAHGWAPVGALQIDLELAAGTEETFHFLLGYAEVDRKRKFSAQGTVDRTPFRETFDRFGEPGAVDEAFRTLKKNWTELLSGYRVSCSDPVVARMINIWNQYQCMVTFNLSRSASLFESGIGRGMGFRDSNQDILGFVHMVPERARQRLLDLSATQKSDGSCYHQYQPLTKKGNEAIGGDFNDDPLWLVLAVCAYLRETGDYSILNESTGYPDVPGSDAALLDHLERSLQYTLDNLGPHGLPLIGHADWNDCLNLNCFSEEPGESFQLIGSVKGSIAESVMIAGLFCAACAEMEALYISLGENGKAAAIREKKTAMQKTVLEHGWDGEWFLRAYDAAGKKIGSHENEEGRIFIESQGWCILGGIGLENGYARRALESVNKHLATKDGIILQQPAFRTYRRELGEISSYPPGYKENAGIFTHNNTWIQIAETMLGNGDRAFEYYLSICPAVKEKNIETYRAEPYVYSQMTSGRDAPVQGEGKNSWLSGTAAWSFVVISQYILGIMPTHAGLRVDPCIPSGWKDYTVTRRYRGKVYVIRVKNPRGVCRGIASVTLNGKAVAGNVLPVDFTGETADVEVVLG